MKISSVLIATLVTVDAKRRPNRRYLGGRIRTRENQNPRNRLTIDDGNTTLTFTPTTQFRKPQGKPISQKSNGKQIETNDLFYPEGLVDQFELKGVDTSFMHVAKETPEFRSLMMGVHEPQTSARMGQQRGILYEAYVPQWFQTDDHDVITVPFGFAADFPVDKVAEAVSALDEMNKDLQCVRFEYVRKNRLRTNPWKNGIVFGWNGLHTADAGGNKCWSVLGLNPGFVGYLQPAYQSVADLGAKKFWQVVSLAETCLSVPFRTAVQRYASHALGVAHENIRPDRDEYLDIRPDNAVSARSWQTLKNEKWLESGHPLELESIMMFGTFDGAKNSDPSADEGVSYLQPKYQGDVSGNPVANGFNNGNAATFKGGVRLTTTDAMQLQFKYCRNRQNLKLKPHTTCTGPDRLGVKRPVFLDRLCDGHWDCFDGSDEGGIAACSGSAETTETNNCCQKIMVNGEICTAGTVDERLNGKDTYSCSGSRVVFWKDNSWYVSESGYGSESGFETDFWVNSEDICPPQGYWNNGPESTQVSCVSDGYDLADNCSSSSCPANSECVNEYQSYTCECEEGYEPVLDKNGNVVECKSIPVKNECRLGQHDCGPQALCVDLKYGYTCQCPHNFIDLNAKKPGRNCQAPCHTIDISVYKGLYELECTHTIEAADGTFRYACAKKPGFENRNIKPTAIGYRHGLGWYWYVGSHDDFGSKFTFFGRALTAAWTAAPDMKNLKWQTYPFTKFTCNTEIEGLYRKDTCDNLLNRQAKDYEKQLQALANNSS